MELILIVKAASVVIAGILFTVIGLVTLDQTVKGKSDEKSEG
jgi:hypothetical protein